MSNFDKLIFGDSSGSNKGFTSKTIHYGIVKNYVQGVGNQPIIRVRVSGLDNHVPDANLPICYPFMPLNISIPPKVGEVVRIILSDTVDSNADRYWVGPVTTDYLNIEGQPYTGGDRMTVGEDAFAKMNEKPHASSLPDIGDAIPNHLTEEPSGMGFFSRGNVDIITRGDELIIRAGKTQKKNKQKKNTKNPAYFLIKFSDDGEVSSINMVADKINMITHDGNPLVPEVKTGKLNDAQIKALSEKIHPLPYGDVLVELLGIIIEVLCNDHHHPFDGQGAIKTALVDRLLNYDLKSLLSNNIKIN